MQTSIEQATNIISQNIPIKDFEYIPIEEGLHRVVHEDIIGKLDLPLFDNSAMDGFVISKKGDLESYIIQDDIKIGENKDISLTDNHCASIQTGAKIPKNALAVIPIENVIIKNNTITIKDEIKTNIRYQGEDVKKGSIIIEQGTKLGAGNISILGSQGITHIKVFKKIKIAILNSGNEIKFHHQNLDDGQIYNSNVLYLSTRIKELNADFEIFTTTDDKQKMKQAIKKALHSDIILTTGGASIGKEDYTKQCFDECGVQVLFDFIDIKPGKPTRCAKKDDTLILNLPGNPLAAAIIFEAMGINMIKALQGIKDKPLSIITKAKQNIKANKKPTLTLGIFDGHSFTPVAKNSAGMISPLGIANSFLLVKQDINQDDNINIRIIDALI